MTTTMTMMRTRMVAMVVASLEEGSSGHEARTSVRVREIVSVLLKLKPSRCFPQERRR